MKTITRGLLPFAAACLAVPAFAQNFAREYSLEIERQPIAAALTEFSRQTGLQIGYFSETFTENIVIGPLSGRYTADAAIAQLLSASGLSFERLNERTIAVTGPESAKSQRRAFSTIGEKTDHRTAPSFVRLANLRLVERSEAAEGVQQIRTAASEREPGDSKRRRGTLTLEEIIVTAQKREERLQDVPISISVLSGDDLDRSTVPGVTEALTRVPGVSVQEMFLGGGAQVAVRGVAAANALFGGSSPTAYYVDSVPFGFSRSAIGPDPDAYDLQRIEVLRGPQGTLYGANALNGVVRVLTEEANPDKFDLKARTSASATEDGGENFRGDMALNVPIIDGKLAARAAGSYQDLSGWIDTPNTKDANDAERRTMRLKISAKPTEKLSMGVSAWLSRADYGAPSIGSDDGSRPALIDEPISTNYDAFGLKFGYELPWFSVTSMTSYLDYTNDSIFNVSGTLGLETSLEAETFAQEVNFNSTHGGSWRWSAGGIYRDSEDQLFQFVDGAYVAPNSARNISESYAMFGELTRSFLDGKLEATGGLRYFEDDVGLREDSRLTGVPPEQLISADRKFNSTTPRLVLTWHPSEQATVYGSYSEGFRSGAHQGPAQLAAAPLLPVEPDTLKNYELGVKGSLLNGRLNFDTALYYIDWQDLQQQILVRVPVGTGFRDLTALVNGDSASGMGFEFALMAAPADALELGVNFSWSDLTMDADVISGATLLFDEGDRINYSPEYTVGASADYVFAFGRNGFEGRISASANYTSEQVVRALTAGVRSVTPGDEILMARTSVSIRGPDHWTATLFVDNVNNEQGSPVRSENGINSVRVRPRTIGAQLEYRF